jgi:hypothetical protein
MEGNVISRHAYPEAKCSSPNAVITCPELVTKSGKILTTGLSHKNNSEGLFLKDENGTTI